MRFYNSAALVGGIAAAKEFDDWSGHLYDVFKTRAAGLPGAFCSLDFWLCYKSVLLCYVLCYILNR